MSAITDKQTGQAKTARIPIKIVPRERLKKPDWIRVKAGSGNTRFDSIKHLLRDRGLHTVCEEASCPSIGECFAQGAATFMILGDLCTRRCPFCDVAHGRPAPPDVGEPQQLAEAIAALALDYVVITSVDRDDLRDGGAQHFCDCIRALAANADRDSRTRFSRAAAARAATAFGRAARRHEPQPRNRAAALPEGASGRGLPPGGSGRRRSSLTGWRLGLASKGSS